MEISEKFKDMANKWRAKVTLDDGSSILLKFQIEPSEDEILSLARKYLLDQTSVIKEEKSESLKNAENAYVLFCRSLNLPDRASSEDINLLCQSLKESDRILEAIEISIRALALINDITQNGGVWKDIEYHGTSNS